MSLFSTTFSVIMVPTYPPIGRVLPRFPREANRSRREADNSRQSTYPLGLHSVRLTFKYRNKVKFIR
jgi:hypothetical protein